MYGPVLRSRFEGWGWTDVWPLGSAEYGRLLHGPRRLLDLGPHEAEGRVYGRWVRGDDRGVYYVDFDESKIDSVWWDVFGEFGIQASIAWSCSDCVGCGGNLPLQSAGDGLVVK